MFLLEGGYKTIDASVAADEERGGVVGDRVPVRVDLKRWGGQFLKERPHDGLHGRRKNEFYPLLQERGDGPNHLGHVGQNIAVVGEATKERP